jgi:hypothetical protein
MPINENKFYHPDFLRNYAKENNLPEFKGSSDYDFYKQYGRKEYNKLKQLRFREIEKLKAQKGEQ